MKKLTRNAILIASVCITTPFPSFSSALEMPNLNSVMQQESLKQQQETKKVEKDERKKPPKKQKKPIELIDLKEKDIPRSFTYTQIKKQGGITIDKANESDIFVQKISLGRKSRMRSILPKPLGFNKKSGEPQFKRQDMKGLLALTSDHPTSIISGQFFDGRRNPTELSFGLKSQGEIKSAGADNRGQAKKIITLINGQAKILDYSWENFDKRTGDFAIVGFDFSVPNRSKSRIGRNYLCLPDPSRRNTSHSLITLTAVEINEKEALQELTKYNCTQKSILKLDGGGSARFWHNGTTTYGYSKDSPDKRTIPHGLAFYEE